MSDLHKKSDGAAGVKPTEIATVFSYHMVDLMFSKMGKVSFNPVCLMYEKKKRRKILFVSSEPNTRSTWTNHNAFHFNMFQYSVGDAVMTDAITYGQDCM